MQHELDRLRTRLPLATLRRLGEAMNGMWVLVAALTAGLAVALFGWWSCRERIQVGDVTVFNDGYHRGFKAGVAAVERGTAEAFCRRKDALRRVEGN